jgi:hypothetical protein
MLQFQPRRGTNHNHPTLGRRNGKHKHHRPTLGLVHFLVFGSSFAAFQMYVSVRLLKRRGDDNKNVGLRKHLPPDDNVWKKNIVGTSAKDGTWDCSYFDNEKGTGIPLASFSTKNLASDWQAKPGWGYDGVPMLNYKKRDFYLKCNTRSTFPVGDYKMMLYANCDYLKLVLDNEILLLDENARWTGKDFFVDRDVVASFNFTQDHFVEITVGVLKEVRSWIMFSWSHIHTRESPEDGNGKSLNPVAPGFSTEDIIACGTTPICHGPRVHCNAMEKTGLKFGEMPWGLCRDFVSLHQKCLVYSFGIRDIYSAELMYGANGCEVHAFDCTVDLPNNLGPNVTFHPFCLGSNSSELKLDGKASVAIALAENGKFMNLPSIIKHLGHENQALTILKMDCEGCEWKGIDTLINTMPYFFSRISMLLLEMHFVTNLAPGSPERADELNTIARVLGSFQDFRTYSYSINSDLSVQRFSSNSFYNELYDAGLFVGACCYEFSMVRKDLLN